MRRTIKITLFVTLLAAAVYLNPTHAVTVCMGAALSAVLGDML